MFYWNMQAPRNTLFCTQHNSRLAHYAMFRVPCHRLPFTETSHVIITGAPHVSRPQHTAVCVSCQDPCYVTVYNASIKALVGTVETCDNAWWCLPRSLFHNSPWCVLVISASCCETPPSFCSMLKTALHHSLAAQRTCRSPVQPSKATRCASRSMTLRAVHGTDVCVSPQWLSSEVAANTNIKVLDATWYMPNWKKNEVEDHKQQRIPGSTFFHVDGIANRGTALPHMLPSQQAFAAAMDALGIDNSTTVVIYDQVGIFSSPRVWWTFLAMGHDASKVRILEGGFPAWKEQGLPIEQGDVADDVIMGPTNAAQQPGASSKYKAALQASKVRATRAGSLILSAALLRG